jgi:hypothetical protein
VEFVAIDRTNIEVSRIALGTWAIWGGRRPNPLSPETEVFGWSIDAEFKEQVEKIINETITDPVGSEFMAPPADSQTNSETGDLVDDDLEKVL